MHFYSGGRREAAQTSNVGYFFMIVGSAGGASAPNTTAKHRRRRRSSDIGRCCAGFCDTGFVNRAPRTRQTLKEVKEGYAKIDRKLAKRSCTHTSHAPAYQSEEPSRWPFILRLSYNSTATVGVDNKDAREKGSCLARALSGQAPTRRTRDQQRNQTTEARTPPRLREQYFERRGVDLPCCRSKPLRAAGTQNSTYLL